MAKFIINGGKTLKGEVKPAGNKNAVLKMIPATLLTDKPVTLTNVPAITDVRVMLRIMEKLGTKIEYKNKGKTLILHTPKIKTTRIDPSEAKKIRASNMLLGPVLARCKEVVNVLPGGDKIGPREMTAHFDVLTKLGARYSSKKGAYTLKGTLKGKFIQLYEPSVTATENGILAAVLAEGETIIYNAACEPHVQELCKMLNAMGAQISGIGTNKLCIKGVSSLHSTSYKVPPDYIYIATFIILAAITNGDILIKDVVHKDLNTILYFLDKMGVKTQKNKNDLKVPSNQKLKIENQVWGRTKGFYSQPWPCFPTDLMSLAIILATQTEGSTLFFEKMYPGRMFFANYLNGMGANIILADPHRIVVNGKTKLHGHKNLQAPDLRAGMAYVAAALAANGKTLIDSVEHIYRGYPRIDYVLRRLGADIHRRS